MATRSWKKFSVAGVMALGLVLGACSSDHDAADHMSSQESGAAADVMFAQMMIPHHEQAVEMADLAATRASDSQLLFLAEEIRGAQAPEIELMQSWLEEWGVPSMTADEAMDAHMSHGMKGMLTDAQLDQLAQSSGAEFDQLFAEFMIEHHKGAVSMARDVLSTGSDPRVAELAREIIVTQEKEILQLQSFLGADVSVQSLAVVPAMGHVHGGLWTGTDLLVGTHDGVHRVDSVSGVSSRVGNNRDDFMAYAGQGEGRLVGSGHPGMGSTMPNPLGLVTSDDGGVTWDSVSLSGEVDFHGVAVRGDDIVGWDTRGPLLWSTDGGQSWNEGPTITTTSLAWFNDQVWLAVPDRGLVTWTPGDAGVTNADMPAVLLSVSPDGSTLWRVDPHGEVHASTDGASWTSAGQVTKIEALVAADDRAFAVTGTSIQEVALP